MKKIIVLLLFFCSCNQSSNPNKELINEIVSEWVMANKRVSNNFNIIYEKKNLNIVFEEVSQTASFLMENIASHNLVHSIVLNLNEQISFDTVIVHFKQPVENVSFGNSKQEVVTMYKYDSTKIEEIKGFLKYDIPSKVFRHITFNMRNIEEVEMEESIKMCQKTFSWFSFKDVSGLKLLVDYSILKSNNKLSNEELKVYDNALSLLYLTLQDANLESKSSLDSLFTIIGKTPPNQTWRELDSLGYILNKNIE